MRHAFLEGAMKETCSAGSLHHPRLSILGHLQGEGSCFLPVKSLDALGGRKKLSGRACACPDSNKFCRVVVSPSPRLCDSQSHSLSSTTQNVSCHCGTESYIAPIEVVNPQFFARISQMSREAASLRKGRLISWLSVRSPGQKTTESGLNRTLSSAEMSSLLGGDPSEIGAVLASGLLVRQKEGAPQGLVKAVLVPDGFVWRHKLTRRVLLTKDTISVTHDVGAHQFELHGFSAHPLSNIGRRLLHVRFDANSVAEANQWVEGFRNLGNLITQQEQRAAAPMDAEAKKPVRNDGDRTSDDGLSGSDLDANPEANSLAMKRSGPPILIIVNPCSGHGKGARVLKHRVLPIFRLAGLNFTVIETERAGHAVRLASEIDLRTCTGGIVCIGGDGLVNEVLNGLFLHPDRKSAMSCPIGVVPAGSDNALVWSVLGVKTATDAALLIVKGGTTPLDAFVVRWDPTADNAAPVPQIGVCMTYYGFMSDALRRSEMPRIKRLGPLKYTAAGAWQMLSLPHYNVDVEFLEFEEEERREWWKSTTGKGSMREAMEAADRDMRGEKRKLSDWEEQQQDRLLNESADEERRKQGIVWNERARELGARWGKNEPPGRLLAADDVLEGAKHRRGQSYAPFWRRAGMTFACAGGVNIPEESGGASAVAAGSVARPGHRHTHSAPAKVGGFEGLDGVMIVDPPSDEASLKTGSSEDLKRVSRKEYPELGAEPLNAACNGASGALQEAVGSRERMSEQRKPVAEVELPVQAEPALVQDKPPSSKPSDAPVQEPHVKLEEKSAGDATEKESSGKNWVRRSGPFLSVMVCNHKCRSVQFLKTQCLAPEAEADDGHLDLMLVKPVGRVDLVRFLTLLQFSKHVDLPYVEYRKVKAVRILPGENDNRSCGIDGELLPLVGPASISVIPRLFNMLGRTQWAS